eukprot:767983-Hanusia_phi.AAC.11
MKWFHHVHSMISSKVQPGVYNDHQEIEEKGEREVRYPVTRKSDTNWQGLSEQGTDRRQWFVHRILDRSHFLWTDLSPRAGCRKRGDCNIHSHLSELVLEKGSHLSIEKQNSACEACLESCVYLTSSVVQIIHLMFGMTPDWGGKPFGIAHYLCVKTAKRHDFPVLQARAEGKGLLMCKERLVVSDPLISVVEESKTALAARPRQWEGDPEHGACLGPPQVASFARSWRCDGLRESQHFTCLAGIYMDIDVITIRSFLPLMKDHSFVMGQEGEKVREVHV